MLTCNVTDSCEQRVWSEGLLGNVFVWSESLLGGETQEI